MSIVKLDTVNRLLGLFAVSVTLILQLLCVHVLSTLNVIVLLPDTADVVTLEQSQE